MDEAATKPTADMATGIIGALNNFISSIGFFSTLTIILLVGIIILFVFIVKTNQFKDLLVFLSNKKKQETSSKKKKEDKLSDADKCAHYNEINSLVEKRDDRLHEHITTLTNSVSDLRSVVLDVKSFVKSEISIALNPIASTLSGFESRLASMEKGQKSSDKNDDKILSQIESQIETIKTFTEQQDMSNAKKACLIKDTIDKSNEINELLGSFLENNKIHGVDLFLFRNGNHSLDGSVQFSTFYLKHSSFDENSSVHSLQSGVDCSILSSFFKRLHEHKFIDIPDISVQNLKSYDKGQKRALKLWLKDTDANSFTFASLKNKNKNFLGFACFYNEDVWYKNMSDDVRVRELIKKKLLVNSLHDLLF